ncbi:unnamed protein product, partial [Iphiclides podalirius]
MASPMSAAERADGPRHDDVELLKRRFDRVQSVARGADAAVASLVTQGVGRGVFDRCRAANRVQRKSIN